MSHFLIGLIANNSFVPTMTKELQAAGYDKKHIAVIKDPEDAGIFELEKAGIFMKMKAGIYPGTIGGLLAGVGIMIANAVYSGQFNRPDMKFTDYLLPVGIIILGGLAGVLLGAIAGGLVSMFTYHQAGNPLDDSYKKEIKKGKVLIGVPVNDKNESNVKKFFKAHRAEEVQTVQLNTVSS